MPTSLLELAIPLHLSFVDTYNVYFITWTKALMHRLDFSGSLVHLLKFCLVHLMNGTKNLTRWRTQVFIHVMRILQCSLISSSFLVLMRYSFFSLFFFLSSPYIWWFQLVVIVVNRNYNIVSKILMLYWYTQKHISGKLFIWKSVSWSWNCLRRIINRALKLWMVCKQMSIF